MAETVGSVLYFDEVLAHGPKVEVDKLHPDDVDVTLAEEMLHLVAETYRVQFEETLRPPFRVPSGTMYDHFRPGSADRQAAYAEHVTHEIEANGSSYFVVRAGIHELPVVPDESALATGGLAALVKVSPSRATFRQKTGLRPPNCYINDVITHPAAQKQGLASAGIHAALKIGKFSDTGVVVLDGYDGNHGPNSFFVNSLGMVLRKDIPVAPKVLENGTVMSMLRYETPPDLGVVGVKQRLAQRCHWLRNGQMMSR